MANKQTKAKQEGAQQRQWMLWGLAALVVIGLAFIFGQGNTAVTSNELPLEVSVAEANQMVADGAFLLDVRTVEEWNENHVPGATLITLDTLGARVDEVPKDQPIVVMCRSGNRSATGRDILLEAGFTNVTSMAGGINDWIVNGFEVISGP